MLTTIGRYTATLLYLVLFSLATAMPGEARADDPQSNEEREPHHGAEKNVIAGFVGVAFEGTRDEGLALGIEYERRLNQTWGIGALAEHTFGDLDTWVFAVPVAVHNGPWKFYAAPGIEDGEHGSEALVRLGVEYGFHLGRWEVSPQFDVDFVDGEEIYVVGFTFGWGF